MLHLKIDTIIRHGQDLADTYTVLRRIEQTYAILRPLLKKKYVF